MIVRKTTAIKRCFNRLIGAQFVAATSARLMFVRRWSVATQYGASVYSLLLVHLFISSNLICLFVDRACHNVCCWCLGLQKIKLLHSIDLNRIAIFRCRMTTKMQALPIFGWSEPKTPGLHWSSCFSEFSKALAIIRTDIGDFVQIVSVALLLVYF